MTEKQTELAAIIKYVLDAEVEEFTESNDGVLIAFALGFGFVKPKAFALGIIGECDVCRQITTGYVGNKQDLEDHKIKFKPIPHFCK